MIYSLSGNLTAKRGNFIVVDVVGVNYKVFISPKTYSALPKIGEALKIFTYLNVKEDAMDLFGFLRELELGFFEKLISISGIGPKSALAIMSVAPVEQLMAAINEGKTELLTRVSGVGKKTSERVILELRGKLAILGTDETVKGMELDLELEEALISLGYSKAEAVRAISKIDSKEASLEERLKKALRVIKE